MPRRSHSRSRSPPRRSDRDRGRHTDRDRERNRDRDRDRERYISKSPHRDRDRYYRYRHSRSRSAERNRKEKELEEEKRHEEEKKNIATKFSEQDFSDKTAEEIEMMKLMGFCGFDSTKGKHIDGNDTYVVNIVKKRKYRQYMNRRGGFNRPLDPVA